MIEHKHLILSQDSVYVGKSTKNCFGSVLANHFVIGVDGDRDQCLQKYRRWLWEHVKPFLEKNEKTVVMKKLLELLDRQRNSVLYIYCWCKQPCHADVIKSCIEFLEEEGW